MKLPEKLLRMEPYDPSVEPFDVKLDANENACTVNAAAQARIRAALERVELNRYPDPAARTLRQAAAAYFGVEAENIGCGCGSDEILSLLMQHFVPSGGLAAMSEFDFSMYAFYARGAERRVRTVPVDGALRLEADSLIEAARGADLLIFSNPCNPTGQGLPRAEVLRVVEESDCLVVVDEAYMDFWNQSVLDCVNTHDNLIVLRTCSKAFGLAALRCGFLVANPELVGYYDRARSPYNMNAYTQAAAAAALEDGEMLRRLTEECVQRAGSLRLMAQGLCAANPGRFAYIPTVTNFALLRVPAREGWSAEYCYEALRARQIGVRCLRGAYLRVTAGTDAENSAVIRALDEIAKRWEAGK